MGENVSLTMALALSEGHKSKGASLRSLSKLTLPFWIVQTSDTTSLLLSAFGKRSQSIETSENTRLSEARRILSSEISSAESIPEEVENISSLMEESKTSKLELKHVEIPDYLGLVTPFIVVREPNITPNRLSETLDSQNVLDLSSNFQELRDTQARRAESIESLKNLINEKLQGHLDVLENRISLEKQQWAQRISALEDRIQQKVQVLGSKTSDEIYDLREKQKMEMRAVTADFSRAITEVEEFYTDIIDQIRNTRTSIHMKGEDVKGAIADFNELVEYISETSPKHKEVLDKISGTSEIVRTKYKDSKSELEELSAEAKGAESEQSADYEKRKVELEQEMEQKLGELDALQENVSNSVTRLHRIVQQRLVELQQKLLEITSFALENNSIKNLAPLTRLDIDTYVATYDNDSYIVFTPGFMPREKILSIYRHQPLDNDFDSYITQIIDGLIQNDKGFKKSFDKACIAGNMLINTDGLESVRSGLTKLHLTHLLEEGAKENFESLWSKYSGQCPKCGNMAGIGTKFCPGCGATL